MFKLSNMLKDSVPNKKILGGSLAVVNFLGQGFTSPPSLYSNGAARQRHRVGRTCYLRFSRGYI